MKQTGRRCIALCFAVALLVPATGAARGMRAQRPAEQYNNAIGGGISLGAKLADDAWFYGWTVDYTRVLSEKWSLSFSLAYDQETETKPAGDAVVNTYSVTIAVARAMTDRLAIGGGFGHGLINDDNSDGGWTSVDFGDDLATGVFASYTLWRRDRHAITPNATLEYNISDGRFALSFDLGYAYSF